MPDHALPMTYAELLDAPPSWASAARDRSRTARLIAARDGLAAAQLELREAVRDAYDGGSSWLAIGTILGISRQAARRRFRRPPDPGDTDPGDTDPGTSIPVTSIPATPTPATADPVRSERLELSLAAT